jgi:plasmid stabilization system protein ParE
MTLPILLLTDAETDLAGAKAWYRRNSPQFEEEFAACVDEILQRIQRYPTAYEAEGPYRRAFLRRFPYRVVYRPTATEIVVVAILHTSRDPQAWRSRNH